MIYPEIETELNSYKNALCSLNQAVYAMDKAIREKVVAKKQSDLREILFCYDIDHYSENIDIDEIVDIILARIDKIY